MPNPSGQLSRSATRLASISTRTRPGVIGSSPTTPARVPLEGPCAVSRKPDVLRDTAVSSEDQGC